MGQTFTAFNQAGVQNNVRFAPLIYDEMVMPGNITASTFMMLLSASAAASVMSVAFTSNLFVGIYKVSSDSIQLINSVSSSFGFAANATNNSTAFASNRYYTFASSQWSSSPVFTQGGEYYIGYFLASSGASSISALNQFGAFAYSNAQYFGSFGASQVTATSVGVRPFLGLYTTTSGALPTLVGNNEIRKTAVNDYTVPFVCLNASPALSAF
jgi:hypothetical protein